MYYDLKNYTMHVLILFNVVLRMIIKQFKFGKTIKHKQKGCLI